MKLYLKDRLTLIELFSLISMKKEFQGLLTMMNIAHLSKKMEITPADQVQCDMKEIKGQITWDPQKDTGMDLEFTAPQLEIIRNGIKGLGDVKVNFDAAMTYLKFIEVEEIV